MSESKEQQPEPWKTPEERFTPETPREKILFERARKAWYENEWLKISQELEKDQDLTRKYEEFLSGAEEMEKAVEQEASPKERTSFKRAEIERSETEEWAPEYLEKINKSNPDKLRNVFFGFLILRKWVQDEFLRDHKEKEAEVLEAVISDTAKAFEGQPVSGLLIEFKNIFERYGVSNSVLNISFLSRMGDDFTKSYE